MKRFAFSLLKCHPKCSAIFLQRIKVIPVIVVLFCVGIIWIWMESARKPADIVYCTVNDELRYKLKLENLDVPIVADASPRNGNPPEQRLVHLDLKGAPPKIAYLKRLLPMLKVLGATGLLIEYEDMFPYQKPIEHLSATNAYSRAEVRELLKAATWAGLSVMPLVQTFGHMEFALKHEQYLNLRETISSPDSICPNRKESMDLIEQMLMQIIEMHLPIEEDGLVWPKFSHLHIGCDEVYNMGQCSRCKSKSKHHLFVSHIKKVTTVIRNRWPHLKVVIWDDMMRSMPLNELQDSQLGDLIEPMIWAYHTNLNENNFHEIWMRYASVFSTVWAASSFKGSAGETAILPPIRKHLENHLQWMALINIYANRFRNGIQGIALTGWQRYNHFVGLCELLPTSIPSLALCLSVSSLGYFEPNYNKTSILSTLSCPQPKNDRWIDLSTNEINVNEYKEFRDCSFPGQKAMEFSIKLHSILDATRHFLIRINFDHSFLSPYAVKHGFGSPINIEWAVRDLTELESQLQNILMNAEEALADYYDKYTINEVIEQKIMPLIDALKKMKENAEYLTSIQVWPRRPLN
ncbi:hexosaminidase D [Sitodiplosis mosellana]|uniref:hexosaminidase D n=1 Tax=Sitodiplosis mosellana TaxID=263140 RepID=UPI00244458C7|nr:hexosaminidase D [Sitodiplosis mosellana]